MAEHFLKCWPNSYDAIAAGVKCFEWRRDDRGFECGDVLVLRKWNPEPSRAGYVRQDSRHYTEQRVRVTYILRGQFGVPPDYCVMSIERMEAT